MIDDDKSAPVPRKSLLQEIRDILAKPDGETQMLRELCRLACKWNVDADSFHELLLEAEIRDTRASEIKAVLLCPAVCERFCRSAKATWKKSLDDARAERPNALQMRAARLVRLLFRNAQAGFWPPEGVEGWTLERDWRGQIRLRHAQHGTLEMLKVVFRVP